MSRFQNIIDLPPDAAFSLVEAYAHDPFQQKVDLCPGFYRDENAQPWILPSVARAKELLHDDSTINHEHLPLSGHPELVSGARRLVFGTENVDVFDRIASIQTIGGTGANHLGALFLSKTLQPANVWIPNPSWIAHPQIWEQLDGSTSVHFYPYFDKKDHSLNFNGMIHTLQNEASENDVVVLHGCAHNPTGIDLAEAQWKEVGAICAEKRLFPLIDLAYQGFATGDLENDAWPIRMLLKGGNVEFAVAQSFSKNFGLYGERVGVLHLVTLSGEAKTKVIPQLERLQRSEITTAPSYGARIISSVLEDEDIRRQWQQDLLHMSGRMQAMRERLYKLLAELKTPGSWEHLLSEKGMFSLISLSRQQVSILREKYHVYMLPSGRISVTGLTEFNVEYVAQSFDSVIKKTASL